MHYFKNIFIISIILTSLINLTGCGGSTGGLTKPVRSPHTKNMNSYSEEEQIIIVSGIQMLSISTSQMVSMYQY